MTQPSVPVPQPVPATAVAAPPPNGPTDQSLAEWIEPKLSLLKSVLTERAFVCFLTGRDYLETLHRARKDPHGILHTLFSDYFFLQYLPDELHAYVRSLLRHEPAADDVVRASEERDLAIVPFVVLFRARLQPIDVRRRVGDLVGPSGEIRLGRSDAPEILAERERAEVVAQVAIESVLEEPNVKARVQVDSHFALLAIDALYYVVHAWRRGDAEIDVSDEAFEAYLGRRTANAEAVIDDLPETDLRLVRSAMHDVVDRLVDPTALRAAVVRNGTVAGWLVDRCLGEGSVADARRAAERVVSLLPDARRDALIARSDTPDRIRWQLDPHGRLLAAPDAIELTTAVCREFEELRRVDDEMRAGANIPLDALREPLALFQASNATWTAALDAHRRLRAANDAGTTYAAMADDLRIVQTYVDELDLALPVIDRAVTLAHAVRGSRQLTVALQAVADVLKLKSRGAAERRGAIEDALQGLRRAQGLQETALAPVGLTARAQLGPRFLVDNPPAPIEARVLQEEYWRVWEGRLVARVQGRSEQPAGQWAEIAWATQRDRAPSLLQRAWESNTASTWTEIAIAAAAGIDASDKERYPVWIAAAALAVLGLSPLALAWGQSILPSRWLSILNEGRSSPLALVVAERRGSLAWSWQLSGAYGLLVTTPEQLDSLGRVFGAAWTPITDRHAEALRAPVLLVEADGRNSTRRLHQDPLHVLRALRDGPWEERFAVARAAWLVANPADLDAELLKSLEAQREVRVVMGASIEDAAAQIFGPRRS